LLLQKNLAKGKDIVSEAERLDHVIQKNYNDALFFAHTMRTTSDETKREVVETRYDIAKSRTEDAKRHLDYLIFV
jgi:hypothetical protein